MSDKLSDKASGKTERRIREELETVAKDAILQIGRMSFHTVTLLALGAAEVIAGTGLIMGKAAGLDGPISLDDQVRIVLGMDPGMVEPGLRDILVLAGHRAGAIAYDACTEFVKEAHTEGRGYDKYLDKLEKDLKDFGYSASLMTSLIRKSGAIRQAGRTVREFGRLVKEKGGEVFSRENAKKTKSLLTNAGKRFARALKIPSSPRGNDISERSAKEDQEKRGKTGRTLGRKRLREIFAPFNKEELEYIATGETDPCLTDKEHNSDINGRDTESRLAKAVEDAGFIMAEAFADDMEELYQELEGVQYEPGL